MKLRAFLVGSVLACFALTLWAPSAATAKSAPTRVAKLEVLQNVQMGEGYLVIGQVKSPNRTCATTRRTVVVRNLSRRGFRVRTRSYEPSNYFHAQKTGHRKGLIRKGDRLVIRIAGRKAKTPAGKRITCRPLVRKFRVTKVGLYGVG